MPIDYRRDDHRRLITVTLTEPFSFDELLSQTDRQWAEHTWEYAVLYDTRASFHVSPKTEIQQLLERTQIVGGGRPRGPVGVAIPPRADIFGGGLLLAQLSGPSRDLEILVNEGQVERWLARHAIHRST